MQTINRIFLCFVFFLLLPIFRISDIKAEEVSYIHTNHHESVSFSTDGNGYVVSKRSYYPYGQTISDEGDQNTEKGYTSQISDINQTNLYYYNARYYNPLIAKFTQSDTVLSRNRYSYVGNNPIVFSDPSGNERLLDGERRILNGMSGYGYHRQTDRLTWVPKIAGLNSERVAMSQKIATGWESDYCNHQGGFYPYEVFCPQVLEGTVNGIVGFVESTVDNPLPVILSSAIYAAASYLGGPQFAESVDISLCALWGGSADCILAAQLSGPNLSQRQLYNQERAVIEEALKGKGEKVISPTFFNRVKYKSAFTSIAGGDPKKIGKGGGFYVAGYGIIDNNFGNYEYARTTLAHEYQHFLDNQSVVLSDRTPTFFVDSEINAYNAQTIIPDITLEIIYQGLNMKNTFHFFRALGISDNAIYTAYLTLGSGFIPFVK